MVRKPPQRSEIDTRSSLRHFPRVPQTAGNCCLARIRQVVARAAVQVEAEVAAKDMTYAYGTFLITKTGTSYT
jgi:hypothetical protein